MEKNFGEIDPVSEATLLEMLTCKNRDDISLGINIVNQMPNDQKRYIMMHLANGQWWFYKSESLKTWECYNMYNIDNLSIPSNEENDAYFNEHGRY